MFPFWSPFSSWRLILQAHILKSPVWTILFISEILFNHRVVFVIYTFRPLPLDGMDCAAG